MRIGVGWEVVAGSRAGSVLAMDQEELMGNFARKGPKPVTKTVTGSSVFCGAG